MPGPPPTPDQLLERFALGELPDEEQRALERQIDADEGLRRRLAELRQDNEEVLARYPAAEMAREIELRRHRVETAERVAARGRGIRTVIGLSTLLAGATAVVMLALPTPEGSFIDPTSIDAGTGPEITRTKGPAELFIHRIAGHQQEPLVDGAFARAGDVLQLSYRSPASRFAVILSIDGRGAITQHFPDAAEAAPLGVGRLTELSHSYELDDAPAFEYFYLVSSEERFAARVVRSAATTRAPALVAGTTSSLELILPEGLEQTLHTLHKVAP